MTGASGLIGKKLSQLLRADNHEVIGLTRSTALVEAEPKNWLLWKDPGGTAIPSGYLEGIDGIVNLAGEPIAGRRWTSEQKQKIRDSRVLVTRRIVEALENASKRPAFLVSASAIGFYGDRGDELLTETSAPGTGFLAEVCREWEDEALRARQFNVRVVNIRVGVVLSREAGALAEMQGIFNFGLGGVLGSGRQWFPWIHINDIANLFRFAVEQSKLEGPINGTAPEPVRNSEFTLALANAMRRPAFLPVPSIAIRALWGEMAELVLGGARVIPDAAQRCGFNFGFPDIRGALKDLYRP